MSDNTHIQWTDATWNPTTGCTKVSPGCANCYIASTPPFRMTGRKFDEKGHIPLILHDDRLAAPLHWAKPRRVFVNSLSDLFHEDIPFEYIDRVFAVMALTPQHTYQVLTKRPERMREYAQSLYAGARNVASCVPELLGDPSRLLKEPMARAAQVLHAVMDGGRLPNVWLGCTVENQHFADERIPVLLDTPVAVRFLSCEPLLGPIDLVAGLMLGNVLQPGPTGILGDGTGGDPPIDWVIVGGESGPKARPTDIEHIRSVVQQCLTAGVPVFVKQLGAKPHGDVGDFPGPVGVVSEGVLRDVNGVRRVDDIRLRDRKGGNPEEWPEDLRVRQFPEVRRAS